MADKKATICLRLIEVALPIREISAESGRQKKAQRGHISTLHLWWARRPLAASRAVVFASLVPDPDDPRCPADFLGAVERHLKTHVPSEVKYYRRGRETRRDDDPYSPYEGMPDTLRNRLLMFIAKWSPESVAFESGKAKKEPDSKYLLDDRSLVKWETSDPKNAQGREVLRIARELVKSAYGGRQPVVLDPFAGGGAIPLEAGRLGCQPIANDYNPVAYLILRATCEFPQKYGRPGRRKMQEEHLGAVTEIEREIPNVLVHDVENWVRWILERARARIGHLYPSGKDGRPVVGYLWSRTAPCSNPSCRGEIPLLRSLLVCNKADKKVALKMDVDRGKKTFQFRIAKDNDIEETGGTTVSRGARCPFCEQITHVDSIKEASFTGRLCERIVAVIVEDRTGKAYRSVEASDILALEAARRMIDPFAIPDEAMPDSPDLVSGRGWNFKTWGSLFNPRQLVAMQTFVACLHEALEAMKKEIKDEEYHQALGIYLGLWLSRSSARYCNVTLWHTREEKFEHPFGRQAIPMTWDYPEPNPFAQGSAGLESAWDLMRRVIECERLAIASQITVGDASGPSFADDSNDLVITDPPYFDAIAYGDLSDYFYVWLKRGLGLVVPEVLVTPLTPKGDEATALKHRHGGDGEKADDHFRGSSRTCVGDFWSF